MLNLFINLLNIHFPFEKQIISFLLWLDSVGYKIFSNPINTNGENAWFITLL